MIISEADATWAADEFINYFGNFTSIEDYLRFVKRELVPKTNPLMSHEDEFFNEDISPEEMEFEIRFIGDRFPNSLPQDHYKNLLAAVSSHNNESNIPGRELRWMVYEKRTQKIVGFIRFGSPTINSKPRNLWLGQPANLSLLNRHTAMGFVIVPSQPFGYNYLGGKLLALLCVSHFARETLNKVFEKDIALFETAMGIVKNLMLNKNKKVEDLIKADLEYNNALYECYMYKTKAKKSINEDVMLAKMSAAQNRLYSAKSKILEKL